MTGHPSDSNGAPTRIAILSDVHGNLPAFRAAIDDVRVAGADAIWFLGDLVGYGAHPDECVALALEECDIVLAGNHDLAVTGAIPLTDFSPTAATAALWTQQHASEDTLAALRTLKPVRGGEAIGLYHGSPRDPIWEYVLSSAQAEECFEVMDERVGAIGHSHVALRFTRIDGEVVGEQAAAGAELDLGQGEWLINPGSVGQPRDRDPRAAWMLVDTERWTGSWRRVEYPIEEAAKAIAEAELPNHLADRLFIGQ